MKKVTIILAGVILMSIASLNAFADGGSTATANATASARIIKPLLFTNSQGIAFGNIAASASPGTVTISTDNVRTSTGGVTPSAVGGTTQAIYTATGENNATYTITLPETVEINSGENKMTVNGFVSNPGTTGTLSGSGTQTINVGATLNVKANQAVGDYTGNYDVTIAYN